MDVGRGGGPGESYFSPKSAELLNDFAPLICLGVRAVRVLGAGLGFLVGVSAPFRFSPTSDNVAQHRFRKPTRTPAPHPPGRLILTLHLQERGGGALAVAVTPRPYPCWGGEGGCYI